MKKLLSLILFCVVIPILSFSQSTEAIYPVIWLQSETIESQQGYWQDAISGKRKALPETKTHFPGSGWFNYNRSLSLDSTSNSLTISYPVKNQKSLTIIVVYHTTDTTEQGLWQLSDKKEIRSYLSTRHLSSGKAIRYADSSITIPAIHTYIPTFRKALQDSCKFIIGSTDSLAFKGKIAEFMVYDRILKGEELQKVQTYLAIKYGVSLIKTNYIDSKANILWDTLADGNYWNSIAGIGKDDYFGLNQKQSHSTTKEDYISMGIEKIYPTNPSNPHTLADNNFLIWGHNGKTFTTGTETTPTGGTLAERRWQIRSTGNSTKQSPITLKVDVKNFDSAQLHNCHLLIDRSGTNTMYTAEHIPADGEAVNGILTFSNIYWDIDHSGSDVFTFSFNEPILKDTTHNSKNNKKMASQTEGEDEANEDTPSGKLSPSTQQGIPTYNLLPNPSRGEYQLNITFPETATAKVLIMDAQGKKVEEKTWKGSASYNIKGHLSTAGIYLIEVESKYESKTFKLVVNN